MISPVEIELKLQVPRASRAALLAALERRSAALQRQSLHARYYDTSDRALAQAGMALRLRREGRRWVQTLKAPGAHALQRFEHEVVRPDATVDPQLHAEFDAGKRLLAVLQDSASPLTLRYETDIKRRLRRVRSGGARIEIAFDQGWIRAGERSLPVCEIEFELLSGAPAAMLAMAERWRARFGLILDPRSKAERGDRLAEGYEDAPLRRAAQVAYRRGASAQEAFRAILDECFAHLFANAVVLTAEANRVEAVHQLRIAIRRLRSAIRCFQDWVEAPPPAIEEGLRTLFRRLGATRDRDALEQSIEPALREAGAPALQVATAASLQSDTPAEIVTSDDAQRLFLALLAWRVALSGAPLQSRAADADGTTDATDAANAANAAGTTGAADAADAAGTTGAADATDAATVAGPPPPAVHKPMPEGALKKLAARRLSRWRSLLVERGKQFAELDDATRHELRKKAKRLRYACEFLAPLFGRKPMRRFLKRLASAQEALGELNDLNMAGARYAALREIDPRAWFALGWVAARRQQAVDAAAASLRKLGKGRPFA